MVQRIMKSLRACKLVNLGIGCFSSFTSFREVLVARGDLSSFFSEKVAGFVQAHMGCSV